MITNDEQLDQAMEQLGRMYRALADLRKEVLHVNARNFVLMAEGPMDEIRRLEEQIGDYAGRADVEINECDVWLRIVGPNLAWPEAPTSIVTAFLDAFRKGVQAIAVFGSRGHLTTRPTKDLMRAFDLRIVAFQAGGLCIGLRAPDEAQGELFGGSDHALVSQALEQFLQVADWVGSDDPPKVLEQLFPDPHERRVLLNSLKPFVPRPLGDVERVEISGRAVPRSRTIALTRTSNQRLDRAIDALAEEPVEVHAGDLREIDLDSSSFILRNAEDVREVRCTFEEDLLESAKEAVDRRVRVTGVRRMDAGRRTAPTLRVIRLEILDEDTSELVAGQTSTQMGSLDRWQ
jgi:hypothetical protein